MAGRWLLPRHHRYMNGARRAFTTHRFDRVVHLCKAETMRRQRVEREAMRRELLKAKFDSPVRMAARALERHAFARQASNRKVGELRVPLTLNHHRRATSLCGLDAKKHGRSPGAARAVDDH